MCPPLRNVWQGGGLRPRAVPVGVFMSVCVCKGEWGKGKGHGKAKRETRGGAGVQ